MSEKPTPESMMGPRQFGELSDICQSIPEIFSNISSPGAESLSEMHRRLTATQYVQGLFRSGRLRKAIDLLDKTYTKSVLHKKRLSMAEPEWLALQKQKRLEREVRFILRLAAILGPRDRPLALLCPAVEKRKRETAAKSLDKAHKALRVVLGDEYLKEVLAPVSHLEVLLRLDDELPRAAQWIREAQPSYPSKRIRDEASSRSRQLINRLADACYRIYGDCNGPIIEHLVSYLGLGDAVGYPDIKQGIDAALYRKKDQFDRRVPNEDYEGIDLLGEWSKWSPATTLDPPWMEA